MSDEGMRFIGKEVGVEPETFLPELVLTIGLSQDFLEHFAGTPTNLTHEIIGKEFYSLLMKAKNTAR